MLKPPVWGGVSDYIALTLPGRNVRKPVTLYPRHLECIFLVLEDGWQWHCLGPGNAFGKYYPAHYIQRSIIYRANGPIDYCAHSQLGG